MPKILTRKQAIADSKAISKYLTQSNNQNKRKAIAHLFQEGLISRGWYECNCPLCEKYNNSFSKDPCEKCPWPGDSNNKNPIRCTYLDSPFLKWSVNPTKENALEMYNLISTFE